MKSCDRIRNTYKFKQMLSNITRNFKKQFFLLLLVYLVGILIGVIVCARRSDAIVIENLFDFGFIEFLAGNKSGIALCFSYILFYVGIACVFIFFNFKPIMCGISGFIIFVCAYLTGFNITAIIITFGFAGILNSIIIIIPLTFFADILLIFIAAIAIKRNLTIKKFGCANFKNLQGNNLNKIYIILLVAIVVMLIIRCLLLPVLKITIIID